MASANNQAIASLVLGIVSLLSCFTVITMAAGIICGIAGLILGRNARKILPAEARTMATLGLVCSIIGLSLWAVLVIFIFGIFSLFVGMAGIFNS